MVFIGPQHYLQIIKLPVTPFPKPLPAYIPVLFYDEMFLHNRYDWLSFLANAFIDNPKNDLQRKFLRFRCPVYIKFPVHVTYTHTYMEGITHVFMHFISGIMNYAMRLYTCVIMCEAVCIFLLSTYLLLFEISIFSLSDYFCEISDYLNFLIKSSTEDISNCKLKFVTKLFRL